MVAGFGRCDVLCDGGGTHRRRNDVSRVFIDTRGGVARRPLLAVCISTNTFSLWFITGMRLHIRRLLYSASHLVPPVFELALWHR